MEHSYYKDRISAYKDSGLNTEEQYLISLHLEECAECRELLVKLESLDKMVESESNLLPDVYFEQLANRIDEKIAGDSVVATDISPKSRWAGLTWKMAATAASLAVLIFIGYHKDDILPPTPFESPSSEAVRSLDIPDSSATGRRDNSEDQAPSVSSPKPSPAKLNRPLSTEGYFSDEDIVGDGEAKGDIGDFNYQSNKTDADKAEAQGKKKTIREESSEVKDSSAKEKIFVRGGRTNEVSDALPEVVTVAGSRKIIDKFKTNSSVSISQQAIEEETVGESDSNYKRARKSVLYLEETMKEDLESVSNDSGEVIDIKGLTETEALRKIIEGHQTTGPNMIFIRKELITEQYTKTRDSLLIAWPEFGSKGVRKFAAKSRSDKDSRLSEVESDEALETELFDLLQNIIRVSEDSLATNRAVKIVSYISNYGISDIKEKARLYLDSLETARAKNGEQRK